MTEPPKATTTRTREALGLLDWAARQAALEAQNAGPDDEPRPRTQRRRVRCDGCQGTTPLLTAHRVGPGWIGDACCWVQHQARRTA